MIRINLSGASRPKGKRAAAATQEYGGGGEGPSSVVFVLIAVCELGALAVVWLLPFRTAANAAASRT